MSYFESLELLNEDVDSSFMMMEGGAMCFIDNIMNESVTHTAFNEFTANIKDALKKAWKKIVEFFKNMMNKLGDFFSGRSEHLNMSVDAVNNGADIRVEMFAGAKNVYKRTISASEEVRVLNIENIGEALEKIGKQIDSVAFNEASVESDDSVFNNEFFNEEEGPNPETTLMVDYSKIPGFKPTGSTPEEIAMELARFLAEQDKKVTDNVYQLLRDGYVTLKGDAKKNLDKFKAAATAVNKYSGKLLTKVRAISNDVIKRAKKEPGKRKLRLYKVLKDVVYIIANFRSYIKDVD